MPRTRPKGGPDKARFRHVKAGGKGAGWARRRRRAIGILLRHPPPERCPFSVAPSLPLTPIQPYHLPGPSQHDAHLLKLLLRGIVALLAGVSHRADGVRVCLWERIYVVGTIVGAITPVLYGHEVQSPRCDPLMHPDPSYHTQRTLLRRPGRHWGERVWQRWPPP